MSIKEGFFPPAAFHDDERWNNSVVKHYSKHLTAMEEPSLWLLSEDSTRHLYRLLWLRTFHQPVVVRLHISEDGTGQMTAKITDGRGGYQPGRLFFSETTALSKLEVDGFLSQVDNLGFWNLPTTIGDGGLDGASWVLEGVKDGQYHCLYRWTPDEGAFKQTALTLVHLAHITVQKIY